MAEVWLWSQKQDIGPNSRVFSGMTYDSLKQKTLLFGGLTSSTEFLNDTWEWDGKFWTQRRDMEPYRAIHSMDYDSQRQRIILFGGVDGTAYFADTWELKTETHSK